ncbi:MAG TPA: FHA domain-containing protein, partial [Vicinamibacteria bacterium]|nr:FHA domain-containing protein [Vicinamibacteria bacterium]
MGDEKLRLVTLSVVGGPLDGRRHDPDDVVTEILIGSDPDCHLVVDRPGVSPIHARIWADLDESVVYDTHAPGGLYRNETRVEGQAPLRPGDVLWLGPPQDPESVCVQCRFEPWVEVLPTSLVSPAATPEDDPFFVAEGQEAGFVPPPKPSRVPEGPAPVPHTSVEVPPAPSPVELVAATIADDWAIAEPEPSGPPAPSPTPPAPPADAFFVADLQAAPSAELAVVVEPIVSPSSEESSPLQPAERAPLPPQVAATTPPPAVSPAPQGFVPEAHPAEPTQASRTPAPPGRPARTARVEPKPSAPSPRPAPTPP